jgi:hypothetical protein
MEMEMKRNRSQAGSATRLAGGAEAAACIATVARELSRGHGEYTMTPATARAMRQVRRGDNGALSFLYVRYAEDVYSHARAVIDEHDAALDITRRVFARLKSPPEQGDGWYDEPPAPPNEDSAQSANRIQPELGSSDRCSTRDDCASI